MNISQLSTSANKFAAEARAFRHHYDQLDNGTKDQDANFDAVELKSGSTITQAVLLPFGRVIEREWEAGSASVRLLDVQTPGWFGGGGACQVQRSEKGEFSGTVRERSSSSEFSSRVLTPDEACRRFVELGGEFPQMTAPLLRAPCYVAIF